MAWPKSMDSEVWNTDVDRALQIQIGLKERIILSGRLRIRLVAGADVAYSRDGNRLYGAVVVMGYPGLKPFEEIVVSEEVSFPYRPGLLFFREGPVLIKALKQLKRMPDIIILDGHGIAHPRGIGIASHVGIVLDMPTIGCAKSRLCGEEEPLAQRRGSVGFVRMDERIIGARVRTKDCIKPVYVSQGYRVSLDDAIDVVLKSVSASRIPEPLRMAHILANRKRREDEAGSVRVLY